MHENLLKLDGKSQTDYRNKTEQKRDQVLLKKKFEICKKKHVSNRTNLPSNWYCQNKYFIKSKAFYRTNSYVFNIYMYINKTVYFNNIKFYFIHIEKYKETYIYIKA